MCTHHQDTQIYKVIIRDRLQHSKSWGLSALDKTSRQKSQQRKTDFKLLLAKPNRHLQDISFNSFGINFLLISTWNIL